VEATFPALPGRQPSPQIVVGALPKSACPAVQSNETTTNTTAFLMPDATDSTSYYVCCDGKPAVRRTCRCALRHAVLCVLCVLCTYIHVFQAALHILVRTVRFLTYEAGVFQPLVRLSARVMNGMYSLLPICVCVCVYMCAHKKVWHSIDHRRMHTKLLHSLLHPTTQAPARARSEQSECLPHSSTHICTHAFSPDHLKCPACPNTAPHASPASSVLKPTLPMAVLHAQRARASAATPHPSTAKRPATHAQWLRVWHQQHQAVCASWATQQSWASGG
jgi:hypothetical protein